MARREPLLTITDYSGDPSYEITPDNWIKYAESRLRRGMCWADIKSELRQEFNKVLEDAQRLYEESLNWEEKPAQAFGQCKTCGAANKADGKSRCSLCGGIKEIVTLGECLPSEDSELPDFGSLYSEEYSYASKELFECCPEKYIKEMGLNSTVVVLDKQKVVYKVRLVVERVV